MYGKPGFTNHHLFHIQTAFEVPGNLLESTDLFGRIVDNLKQLCSRLMELRSLAKRALCSLPGCISNILGFLPSDILAFRFVRLSYFSPIFACLPIIIRGRIFVITSIV